MFWDLGCSGFKGLGIEGLGLRFCDLGLRACIRRNRAHIC